MTENAIKYGVRTDGIGNYINGLGTEFDPTVLVRPSISFFDRLLTSEIDALYITNDLAARIIDEVVDDAIAPGWKVFPKDGGDEIDVKDIFDPSEAVDEAAKLARLYGGSALLMASPGSNLEASLEDEEILEIQNLVVLDRWEVTPSTWTTDPNDLNFRKPETYLITFNNPGGQVANVESFQRVHYTRLLRIKGVKLPNSVMDRNDGWGDGALQRVWSSIRNFDGANQSIANLIQKFEVGTYSIKGLSIAGTTDEGRQMLAERMKLVHDTLSTVNAILVDADGGEDYTRQFASVQGIAEIWDRLANKVSLAAEMPMTQLFGTSPGGTSNNDESGKGNWRKRVKRYRKNRLQAILEKYYGHALGRAVIVIFNDLNEMSPKEEADVQNIHSKTRLTYVTAGIMHKEESRVLMAADGLIRAEDVADLPEQEGQAGTGGDLTGDVAARAAKGSRASVEGGDFDEEE